MTTKVKWQEMKAITIVRIVTGQLFKGQTKINKDRMLISFIVNSGGQPDYKHGRHRCKNKRRTAARCL